MRQALAALLLIASVGPLDGAEAASSDRLARRLEEALEAARLPRFTQPVWEAIDRAAERAAAEALTESLPEPLGRNAQDLLEGVLEDRVKVRVRFEEGRIGGLRVPVPADLERIKSGTPVRWERHGPVRIPVPDLPLVDVDLPLVDKVGEAGPLPLVLPEPLAP
jgi:hypothetical protein